MKCPNCGAEMADGSLYCEACGEDIHMVPDFEPELEMNMEISLDQIREDVDTGNDKPQDITEEPQKKARHVFRLVLGIFAILLLGATIYGGVMLYQYFSLDYQIKSAHLAVEKEQYDKAIHCYTRALELDSTDVGLKYDLAEVYFLKNNKSEYERLLSEIIADSNSDAEQLESAYGKLIAVYKAREDYQTINELLLGCEKDSIRVAYQSYLALPPQFSVPAGMYDSIIALKLTVTGNGKIYYTLDGTEPTTESRQYTAPILLDLGEYTIKALFVNERNVPSRVVTAEYIILPEELDIPRLNPESGDYTSPTFIAVTNDIDDVYYTTDDSVPTIESTRYTEPIPMPLGQSHYNFVRIVDGQSSAVQERDYKLTLQTNLSPQQAVETITLYADECGKVTEKSPYYEYRDDVYKYQFMYAVSVSGAGDFYAISESLWDSQGNSNRTGNYYAVDIYTGTCYRLQIQSGTYRVLELDW